MTMTIDWNRPIVTNAGKPAQADRFGNHERLVVGDWGWGPCRKTYNQNGTMKFDAKSHVRNATSAEILAHPDVWPEWQEWARKQLEPVDMHQQRQDDMRAQQAEMLSREHAKKRDWLTPETAIGCTLPCGAKVVLAEVAGKRGNVLVRFDRPHNGWRKGDGFEYTPAGHHAYNSLPNLIPAAPTPQPDEHERAGPEILSVRRVPGGIGTGETFAVTHAAILAAVETIPEHAGPVEAAEHLCNALGVEVPVKRAPWRDAYIEATGKEPDNDAAGLIGWVLDEAAKCKLPGQYMGAELFSLPNLRRRIMGQEQQP